MKHVNKQPDSVEFGLNLQHVKCPFCDSSEKVEFMNMTAGAANEILMRCGKCRSFFSVIKDLNMLAGRRQEPTKSN